MDLIVPIPILTANGAAGPLFSEAAPITIACNPVTWEDGTPIDPLQTKHFGYFLYRKQSSGAGQIWDAAARKWLSATAQPEPETLFYQDGQWQGLLVAIGQQDAAGAPMLATDLLTHYPRYYVRCLFSAADPAGDYYVGLSGPSADFELLSMSATNRAGVGMEPEDAAAAERIFLFLKDAGLAERGRVEIRRQGSSAVVSLTVVAGVSTATVTILDDGNIVLTPASGQKVFLDGNVQINGDLNVIGQGSATGGFV
jgi:hypothetical protein